MAKIITQETYDEILKENIVEFSMPIEEAREETIKQLEAQVKSCLFSHHLFNFYIKFDISRALTSEI